MAASAQPGEPAPLAVLRAEAHEHLDPLVESIIGLLRTSIPSYAGVSDEGLRAGVIGDVRSAIDAATADRLPTEAELEHCAQVGDLRARQGVPVEELIRAFQVGGEATLEFLLDRGRRLRLPAEALLELSRAGWAWANAAMTHAARAHRRTELELARRDQQQRAELLRALVLGGGVATDLQARLPVYGLSPSDEYVVVRARPATGEDPSVALRPRRGIPALSGVIDGDLVVVAPDCPDLGPQAIAGVAGPAPPHALTPHFEAASRALHVAASFGLPGAHRLDELGVLPAVLLDRDVGKAAEQRCLGAFGDDERTQVHATLEALLDHDLRIAPAARALHLHENSVRKRLDRYEEVTGLSIRRVQDVIAIWWALQHARVAPRGALHNAD